MQKKLFLTVLCLLCCISCACESESTSSGDECSDNTKGRYADDLYSQTTIDAVLSPKISETGKCPDAYPFCQVTVCTRCEGNDIWITDDEQISRCMSCDEILECHSESCQKAKTDCSDAQTECTPGCRNGTLITCQNGTELKEPCKNGCDDEGKTCKSESACTPGCRDGSLIICENGTESKEPCKNGCDDEGKACKSVPDCGENEILSDSECICDSKHGWIGTAGSCKCNEEDGYKQNGKLCEPPLDCDESKEIYNPSTGTCECDIANHWSGTAGHCICADGYSDILGSCIGTGVTCSVPHTIYDPEKDKCICDSEGHWIGTKTGCVCEDGYTEADGVCQ